jgi:hypothetical protein
MSRAILALVLLAAVGCGDGGGSGGGDASDAAHDAPGQDASDAATDATTDASDAQVDASDAAPPMDASDSAVVDASDASTVVDATPDAAPCECSTGACCDGCHYLPSTHACDPFQDGASICLTESNVRPGSFRFCMDSARHCSGSSSDCSGAVVLHEGAGCSTFSCTLMNRRCIQNLDYQAVCAD